MRATASSTAGTAFTLALLAGIVAAGVLMLTSGRNAGAQSGPSLAFSVAEPGNCIAVDEGDEVGVALQISGVQDLLSWEATVVHDFDVIQIVAKDTRLFITENGGAPIEAVEPLPDNNGRHLLSISVGAAGAVSGSGTLAIITFEAVGAGVSVIDIPQTDLDGNGSTDEGAILTRRDSAKISDNNGDNFFDGPVQRATVAVGESCSSPTEKPTDPPTPGPSITPTPTGGSDGSPAPGNDTGAPVGGSATPDNSTQPSALASPVADASPTSTAPGTGGSGSSDGDETGSSVPLLLIAALLAGGLGLGGAVLFLVRRSSEGRPAL